MQRQKLYNYKEQTEDIQTGLKSKKYCRFCKRHTSA
ncbi:MAG: hypothetical protein MZU95_06245 [Desulfomicrobium escambiense]|nr:hypothetical protein [Desulfomicrobium escambiense]